MSTAMMLPTFFEPGWVATARTGDNSLYSKLVKAYGSRVYRLAKYITQNDKDAGDVLVETFAKASSDWEECRENEAFWFTLVTIAVEAAFAKLRYRAGAGCPSAPPDPCEDLVIREVSSWGDNYQERYSREQTTGILEDAMWSLDPMCRVVFVLRDIEEMPVERTAEVLNRSAAAVEVCLLRARLQLRQQLAGRFTQAG